MARPLRFRAWSDLWGMSEVFSIRAAALLWPDGSRRWGDDGMVFMQYTGLEDKAGVEIYEGDILEVGSLARRFSVEWGIGGFCTGGDVEDTMCRIDLRHLSTVYDSKMVMVEVIGNIHENPELLDGTP